MTIASKTKRAALTGAKNNHFIANVRDALLRGGRVTKFKAIVASIAPMMGAIVITGLSAGQAQAANECGPDGVGADTITCTAVNYAGGGVHPDFPTGITYAGSDGLELILNDAAIRVGNSGVHVTGTGAGDISVLGTNFGTITTTGNGAQGLYALTTGLGDTLVQMDGGTVTTGGGSAYGLRSEITNATSTATATALLTAGDIITTGPAASGVYALTTGLGDTLAQMSGGTITVEGANTAGLVSRIKNTSSTATATALMTGGSITSKGVRLAGIFVQNSGQGLALAQMEGGSILTEGQGTVGIGAFGETSGSGATVTALLIDGDVKTIGNASAGLRSFNRGNGITTAQIDGGTITTTGNGAHGLYAQTTGTGLATATVSGTSTVTASGGGAEGIRTEVAQAGATYAVAVNDTAVVTGGSGLGAGIHTVSVADTSGTIDVAAGATVDGATNGGEAIIDDDGDVTANIAGTVSGMNIALGDGSDVLNIAATADISGIAVALDGGDDYGIADTWIDNLTLTGQTLSQAGTFLINWENLTVDGGSLEITDGALIVGADAGTGLTLTNAGILDAGGALALTGNLTTSAGGTFDGTGAGAGIYSVSGSVLNDGVITTQDGAVGDVITVAGDYSGAGQLLVDTDFALDTSDTLVIGGDVTGGITTLLVNSIITDPYTATGNDVLVVDVTGTTVANDFTLAGGPITLGAYNYDLELQGTQFFLAGSANSTGAVYEAAPTAMLGFTKLPTLEQRVGQRQQLQGQPIWVRLHGDRLNTAPASSTSGNTSVDSNTWGLQAGIDFPLDNAGTGSWVLGVTAQYGTISTSVANALGTGSISTEGYGLGATATWYADNNVYVDMQGQVNWIDSDISSSGAGALATGQDATTYALSLEVGQRIELNNSNGTLVPQAQLTWGKVDGGSFTDTAGNAVDLGNNDRKIARLGLAYEFDNETEGQKLYVIGNWLHDFSSPSSVDVAGATLNSSAESDWGEIGIGGSYNFNETSMLYGEATYRTSLSGNAGSNNGLSATAGLRIQW